MEKQEAIQRTAWSLAEIAQKTGLSLGYLRNEQRAGRLPIRRFGRRVLVLDEDLRTYLRRGSKQAAVLEHSV
jgi:excisionase family DNA binding protein